MPPAFGRIFRVFQYLSMESRRVSRSEVARLLTKYQLADRSVSYDLGCGPVPKNPFGASVCLGLDIVPYSKSGVARCALGFEPFPIESCTVDAFCSYDFLEHVPRHAWSEGRMFYPFIEVMNEIHRCLKPGGLLFSSLPCYPFAEAYADPTHVNIITEKTIPLYFCKPKSWAKIYGYSGCFDLLESGIGGGKYIFLIKKCM